MTHIKAQHLNSLKRASYG